MKVLIVVLLGLTIWLINSIVKTRKKLPYLINQVAQVKKMIIKLENHVKEEKRKSEKGKG